MINAEFLIGLCSIICCHHTHFVEVDFTGITSICMHLNIVVIEAISSLITTLWREFAMDKASPDDFRPVRICDLQRKCSTRSENINLSRLFLPFGNDFLFDIVYIVQKSTSHINVRKIVCKSSEFRLNEPFG
uniref:Galectin n=1 Tax=Parascaris univalens TaxID=6257 RepID=A0A915A606_PARUN